MDRPEIVVGLDESKSARQALRWAASYAERTDSDLRAVNALSWPLGVADPAEPGYLSPERVEDIYRASITRVFDEINPRSDWVLQLATGDAGPVLVRQSRDASLLVVGTPEHVGLGRLIAGWVAHYCVSHATCPVVVVPAAPPQGDPSIHPAQLVKDGVRS
jgi:nucleotide-binding universal stress UspA family protein